MHLSDKNGETFHTFILVALTDDPAPKAARAGDVCPKCGEGILDYDGMLNLVCPRCHFVEGGCFT